MKKFQNIEGVALQMLKNKGVTKRGPAEDSGDESYDREECKE